MSSPDWPGRQPGNEVDDLVASYLLVDIQRSPEWAGELKAQLARVQAGEIERWARLGNAYELVLASAGSSIEALHGPTEGQPVAVPQDTLRAAIEAWCESIGAVDR